MANKMIRFERKIFHVSLGLLLAGIPAVVNASVSYTYDDAGRIVTALYDNNVCVLYAYDANGNRTTQTVSASGAPGTPTWGTDVLGCFRWTT